MAAPLKACDPSGMDLDAYFNRIQYDGSPGPNERTLTELHAAHLAAIPYENLDIQLDEPKRARSNR